MVPQRGESWGIIYNATHVGAVKNAKSYGVESRLRHHPLFDNPFPVP